MKLSERKSMLRSVRSDAMELVTAMVLVIILAIIGWKEENR